MSTRLIFIYAADSGVFNTVTDMAHKIFSPKTYECQLCKISHGWFGMHEQWRKGIEDMQVEPEYHHRDRLPAELEKNCKDLKFPCILLQEPKSEARILMDPDDISQHEDINDLLKVLTQKLKDK